MSANKKHRRCPVFLALTIEGRYQSGFICAEVVRNDMVSVDEVNKLASGDGSGRVQR